MDRPLPDGDEDALSIHSSTSGYSASPPVESLVAGNKLSAGDRSGLGALAVQAAPKAVERVSRTGAVVEHKKKNKRKREKQGGDLMALEDTNAGITDNLQKQLVLRANEKSRQVALKKRQDQKKRRRKDPGKELLRILTKSTEKKSKKK